MDETSSVIDQRPAYAGDVAPAGAFATLADDEEAVLVDCRTRAEWEYVGTPDLAGLGKEALLLEWLDYPDGKVDAEFADKLVGYGVQRHAPVFFLCRSGVRSIAAAKAATEAAYESAYNILEGFEGPTGPAGIRNISGWKVSGLPWKQT
jgi:rhodanese-related sulfurtransferase